MEFLKKVWKAVDGKKTITGVAVIVGAVVLDALGLESASGTLLAVGVPVFAGGLFHKVIKKVAAPPAQ